MAPGNIATLGGLFFQIIFSAYFIVYCGWGLLGAGLAVSCSNILQSIIFLISLFYYQDLRQAQFWPSMNAQQWSYMKEFLALGVPSMMMACLEIGGVEMM
jgi:Na+-driven multidrug efflux pump